MSGNSTCFYRSGTFKSFFCTFIQRSILFIKLIINSVLPVILCSLHTTIVISRTINLPIIHHISLDKEISQVSKWPDMISYPNHSLFVNGNNTSTFRSTSRSGRPRLIKIIHNIYMHGFSTITRVSTPVINDIITHINNFILFCRINSRT